MLARENMTITWVILLLYRHCHDSAGAVCHPGRAGVAALCHFVMRY
uniref:Uncharacterized protein n=1 Tax=Leclercia adecarboxylata TaxID=83655 RepID=A0A7G5F648_9ENTR|nr:hypothetical protein [Leclercia adecarboxylata]